MYSILLVLTFLGTILDIVGFSLYKQGMELLKYCNDKLDTVEKKMLQMNEDGEFSEFQR